MRMKKNICAILACAMIFGAFSIPVAEAKEAPVMQIMEMRATGEFSFDTPPGDYYGETGGPSKDTEKYGPNKFIRMKGNQDPGYENLYVDGDYVTRGRSGLLIHGGRDQTSLWNTEGCVRIFDKDAKKITGLMDSWRSAGYHQFGRIKITRPGQSL